MDFKVAAAAATYITIEARILSRTKGTSYLRWSLFRRKDFSNKSCVKRLLSTALIIPNSFTFRSSDVDFSDMAALLPLWTLNFVAQLDDALDSKSLVLLVLLIDTLQDKIYRTMKEESKKSAEKIVRFE